MDDDAEGFAALSRAREHAERGQADAAVSEARRALALATGDARLQHQAGDLLARLGRYDEAERAFMRTLQLAPDYLAVRYNLGLLKAVRGDYAEAARILEVLCRRRPDQAAAWLQLGGALNALGRYEPACKALERHVALEPNSAVGWNWLGGARQGLGRFDEAEAGYRRALAIDPNLADAHSNLGRLLHGQGMPEAARASLGAALENDPGHGPAREGLAALLDEEGRYDEALAVALGPDNQLRLETVAVGARVLCHLDRPTEARDVVVQALRSPGSPVETNIQLHYTHGQVLDELGDATAAARCFVAANRMERDRFGAAAAAAYLAEFERTVDSLINVFDGGALDRLARSGCGSERPLFVVGLPRSGKSLVEQILCSHPDICGGGELIEIGGIAVQLGAEFGLWPDCIRNAPRETLRNAAEQYLGRLAQVDPAAARVTDTMPFNFLHLGLIELLFPRARVIHCVRHPADLALRCFMKPFAGRSLCFTSDLGDIATYLSHYRRLMRHWARVSRLSVCTIRYESLVRSPETAARTLIDFTGLGWDERCLRYFEPGVATSASYTPLRQGLDEREVETWRSYGSLLAGILGQLGCARYERGEP